MKFIIKVFPEIMMKSIPVRKRFMKVLAGNIRHTFSPSDETLAVVQHWDFIEVRSRDERKYPILRDGLKRISGIHHVLEVGEVPFKHLDDIAEYVYEQFKDALINKTFCVRVKRRGVHDFDSMAVMRHVGGVLNQRIKSAQVKLKNPDITINLELDGQALMVVKNRFDGLSGFPMSTQEDVLSLISGGFDSAVASFMLMRRGSRVHYCFFNLGGQIHEFGVKQMAYHLWQRYSKSHKVHFIAVDFEPVVAEILTKIDDGLMGVVLKRMMVRAASDIAKRLKIEAIVTGEAIGQVASQTLTNLRLIDEASKRLVLRPLIVHDKEVIMRISQEIGAFDIAKNMPEFCGVISKSPTVKAQADKIADSESRFDFAILEHAIDTATLCDIRKLADIKQANIMIPEQVQTINVGQVVIDVRSPDDVADDPIKWHKYSCYDDNFEVLTIPFYRMSAIMPSLDKHKTYLLYCKQGVMSGLQAVQMIEFGFDFDKVKILRLQT